MKNVSLSTLILAGVLFGAACGIFLGEYASGLSLVGDAFIGLLQMTVLPYIIVALISNIGRLSVAEGKRFGFYAGAFLLVSLGLTLGAIVLLPLSLPARESASFFSTGSLQDPTEVDFLSLFIPSNPFHSLANNVVPAVVLFCIAVGLAVMTLKQKQLVLDPLDFLTDALGRINRSLVKLTPLGVFAIVASTAGTMQIDELDRLQAYLILFGVATLVIGFGVLLPLLSVLTPFSYGQLLRASRAPVLTAFATGKVFIVLPMLVAASEELFREQDGNRERSVSYARAVTPLVYPFPHAGKLLALLFLPFAAWFADQPIAAHQYPLLLGTGLFSLFGSPLAAIPFLLDQLRLPADMFQLFVVSGLLASRLGDLLGTIHLLFVSVLTTCALTGKLRLQLRSLLPSVSSSSCSEPGPRSPLERSCPVRWTVPTTRTASSAVCTRRFTPRCRHVSTRPFPHLANWPGELPSNGSNKPDDCVWGIIQTICRGASLMSRGNWWGTMWIWPIYWRSTCDASWSLCRSSFGLSPSNWSETTSIWPCQG